MQNKDKTHLCMASMYRVKRHRLLQRTTESFYLCRNGKMDIKRFFVAAHQPWQFAEASFRLHIFHNLFVLK
ncbi:hypothetical protein XI25_25325 [Paenibacillus sp. DMB20]|nr:hypothetical protein XI25_25325 [Paenibacillus sp. DMB20]